MRERGCERVRNISDEGKRKEREVKVMKELDIKVGRRMRTEGQENGSGIMKIKCSWMKVERQS